MTVPEPITCACGARIHFREEDGALVAIRSAPGTEHGIGGAYDFETGVFRAYGPDNLPPHIDPNAPPMELTLDNSLGDAELAELGMAPIGSYPYLPEVLFRPEGDSCARCGYTPEPFVRDAISLDDGSRIEFKRAPGDKIAAVRFANATSEGVYGSFDEATREFRAYSTDYPPEFPLNAGMVQP